MSSKNKNLSDVQIDSDIDMSEKSFGLVVSEWNSKITSNLAKACIKTLKDNGVAKGNIHRIDVPGSFELPLGARLLAGKEKLDAVICLGCVIKGETKHDEYINNAVANGIMNLALTSGKPIIFGILTPNDEQQAIDRSGGKYGNKGVESASTALKMVALAEQLKYSESTIGFAK